MKILIIGCGLAGVCLGHHLEGEGCEITIIDKGENFSSAIAAGMINPMVFRRMLKTWRGDEVIPYLVDFYAKMEQKIGGKFFFPRKIKRYFSTEEEANLWEMRVKDSSYSNYTSSEKEEPQPFIHNTFGVGTVFSPGYVDATLFMQLNHHYFKSKKCLITASFDYNELNTNALTYKNERYDKIVFAEGYSGVDNPFFNYLPLNQTKGEVLKVAIHNYPNKDIINRKCFILPTEDGTYRVGATFAWKNINTKPTEEGKQTLLEQYNKLCELPLSIIEHEAGIRPTVSDRRPLIGEHPTHKGLFIFNGLGTKGYMLGPYFAHHFTQHLLHNTELDDEVNISRFQ